MSRIVAGIRIGKFHLERIGGELCLVQRVTELYSKWWPVRYLFQLHTPSFFAIYSTIRSKMLRH